MVVDFKSSGCSGGGAFFPEIGEREREREREREKASNLKRER